MNNQTQKKLYLVKSEAKVGGVCAGLARYLNFDVSIIRAIFVFSFFLGMAGVWAYIILWLICPTLEENQIPPSQNQPYPQSYPYPTSNYPNDNYPKR